MNDPMIDLIDLTKPAAERERETEMSDEQRWLMFAALSGEISLFVGVEPRSASNVGMGIGGMNAPALIWYRNDVPYLTLTFSTPLILGLGRDLPRPELLKVIGLATLADLKVMGISVAEENT